MFTQSVFTQCVTNAPGQNGDPCPAARITKSTKKKRKKTGGEGKTRPRDVICEVMNGVQHRDKAQSGD